MKKNGNGWTSKVTLKDLRGKTGTKFYFEVDKRREINSIYKIANDEWITIIEVKSGKTTRYDPDDNIQDCHVIEVVKKKK